MLTDDQRLARRIERRVLRFIREHDLLRGGERVLLAVSGGADSLALLGIMARLAGPLGIAVQAVYVNHLLRSEAEVAGDIETVAGVAGASGVPFTTCTVPERGGERGRSPEEALRWARYQALHWEARRIEATTVATGHTRSDQAETVLLRLLRGAGLHGLSAIAPSAPWPDAFADQAPALIRPLLGLGREETAAYCRARGIEPRHDRENENRRYLRNRVRHEVMPRLRDLNPAVEAALSRLAEEAHGLRSGLAGGRPEASWLAWDGQRIVLDKRVLRGLAAPARLAALRVALQSVLPERPAPARAHLEALDHIVALDRAAEMSLPSGRRAWTEGTRLVIGRGRAPRPALPEAPVPVPVPGSVTLPGWLVTAETGDWAEEERFDGWSVVLTADVADGLTVGPRRPGDRIDVGIGHQRVQDLLVDRKVPRWERDYLPVCRTPRGIVWVAGVRGANWALRYRPGPFVRLTVARVADEAAATGAGSR